MLKTLIDDHVTIWRRHLQKLGMLLYRNTFVCKYYYYSHIVITLVSRRVLPIA